MSNWQRNIVGKKHVKPAGVVHEAEHWEESTTACLSKHDCVRLQQTWVSLIKHFCRQNISVIKYFCRQNIVVSKCIQGKHFSDKSSLTNCPHYIVFCEVQSTPITVYIIFNPKLLKSRFLVSTFWEGSRPPCPESPPTPPPALSVLCGPDHHGCQSCQ